MIGSHHSSKATRGVGASDTTARTRSNLSSSVCRSIKPRSETPNASAMVVMFSMQSSNVAGRTTSCLMLLHVAELLCAFASALARSAGVMAQTRQWSCAMIKSGRSSEITLSSSLYMGCPSAARSLTVASIVADEEASTSRRGADTQARLAT